MSRHGAAQENEAGRGGGTFGRKLRPDEAAHAAAKMPIPVRGVPRDMTAEEGGKTPQAVEGRGVIPAAVPGAHGSACVEQSVGRAISGIRLPSVQSPAAPLGTAASRTTSTVAMPTRICRDLTARSNVATQHFIHVASAL